ncbi:MAG: serine acetyltransferase [Bacteroidales bacterium]|nr:serine acetyltransferase [Bacteroidales bacterium]
MKDIAIYGFGGLGREVACVINKINEVEPTWNIIGYFDDGEPVGKECKYGKVLGNIDTLNAWQTPLSVVIAIATPKYLELVSSKITNPLVDFPNIIAPGVFKFDEESVSLGKGNLITFGCRFSCNVTLGDFNVLDGMISLGHEACIGSYNAIFPETRISGQTSIGDKNFFGARCFVAQCLKVGNGNRFGAGTFVLRKIKDDGLYMGNPAKKVTID